MSLLQRAMVVVPPREVFQTCRTDIFFTWVSSEHGFHLDVKWGNSAHAGRLFARKD
jgi:hypothetical protein